LLKSGCSGSNSRIQLRHSFLHCYPGSPGQRRGRDREGTHGDATTVAVRHKTGRRRKCGLDTLGDLQGGKRENGVVSKRITDDSGDIAEHVTNSSDHRVFRAIKGRSNNDSLRVGIYKPTPPRLLRPVTFQSPITQVSPKHITVVQCGESLCGRVDGVLSDDQRSCSMSRGYFPHELGIDNLKTTDSEVLSSLSGVVDRIQIPFGPLAVMRPSTYVTFFPLYGERYLLPLISLTVSPETRTVDHDWSNKWQVQRTRKMCSCRVLVWALYTADRGIDLRLDSTTLSDYGRSLVGDFSIMSGRGFGNRLGTRSASIA
ncbi:hypothetical protein KCU62_g121, partial [Aureobasidium sp. EXF-3399]